MLCAAWAPPTSRLVEKAITTLGTLGDPSAVRALEALYDDRLKAARDGQIFVIDADSKALTHAVTGAVISPRPSGLRDGEMNNTIRRRHPAHHSRG